LYECSNVTISVCVTCIHIILSIYTFSTINICYRIFIYISTNIVCSNGSKVLVKYVICISLSNSSYIYIAYYCLYSMYCVQLSLYIADNINIYFYTQRYILTHILNFHWFKMTGTSLCQTIHNTKIHASKYEAIGSNCLYTPG
jgi:hypothetical protein